MHSEIEMKPKKKMMCMAINTQDVFNYITLK